MSFDQGPRTTMEQLWTCERHLKITPSVPAALQTTTKGSGTAGDLAKCQSAWFGLQLAREPRSAWKRARSGMHCGLLQIRARKEGGGVDASAGVLERCETWCFLL